MTMEKADLLIVEAKQLVTMREGDVPRRGVQMQEIGLIENGAVAIKDKKIVDVGESPKLKRKFKARHVISAKGKVVTPGLVDPHTHLVFAGTREEEFEMRIKGATYQEIAKSGGGILSTLKATRDATKTELIKLARERLERIRSCGATTVEIKSGYGLTREHEIKLLSVIKELAGLQICNIVPTFLGAHAIPPEFKNKPERYLDAISDMLSYISRHHLSQFCDVFCDETAFNLEQARHILLEASRHGLIPKIHADEFKDTGGARLAADVGAISADHLGFISADGIMALKKSSTIAVLLPGTSFFLDLKRYAPARELIREGIPVALGSDFNPGSCTIYNLSFIMNIACIYLKMTPAEVLTATTINAASAINMHSVVGSIEPGKLADLVIWDTPSYRAIPYMAGHPPAQVIYHLDR